MIHANRLWLIFAIVTTLAWGLWGALIGHPVRLGFPDALGYVVWSLTMIPPALVAMWLIDWKLDRDIRSVVLGFLAGLLGAGGQLILLQTVPNVAPEYLVFPLIALNPLITILFAAILTKERVHLFGWIGILLAMVAGVILSYKSPEEGAKLGPLWLVYPAGILLAWGLQGFVISKGNKTMKAESIFFYMTISALCFAPLAWAMLSQEQKDGWGWSTARLCGYIQILNSVGALLLVYAYRYGKAMIVAPLTNAGAPAITVILSLTVLASGQEGDEGPGVVAILGMVLALVAAVLMAFEEESKPDDAQPEDA